jgi:beta-barrel assembly-enhancing protease
MRRFQYSSLLIAGMSLAAQEPGNLYNLEKEAALGRQLASEMSRQTTAIDNSSVEDYLKRLGARIAAQIPDAKLPFTFRLIADEICRPTHEPGSFPGGYIYVPLALFGEADDEAEFAGMLAHSMEHVALRHGTRAARQGQIANSGMIPVIFLGGWNGTCADESVLVPASFRETARNYELEADAAAVQAISRAGLDPSGLARYLERRLRSGAPRVSAAKALVDRLPIADYQVTSGEFVAVQREVAGLMRGQRQ